MNVEKTRAHYEDFDEEDRCPCAYCRNYEREIARAYPALRETLEEMGIDIKKPFETMPLEPDADGIDYIGAQYLVLGEKTGFERTHVGDVVIDLAETHPTTDLEGVHFVIEVGPVHLPWTEEKSEF